MSGIIFPVGNSRNQASQWSRSRGGGAYSSSGSQSVTSIREINGSLPPTPSAAAWLPAKVISRALQRHQAGDWGDVAPCTARHSRRIGCLVPVCQQWSPSAALTPPRPRPRRQPAWPVRRRGHRAMDRPSPPGRQSRRRNPRRAAQADRSLPMKACHPAASAAWFRSARGILLRMSSPPPTGALIGRHF